MNAPQKVFAPGYKCRICGNAKGITEFTAREMMFGSREPFAYFMCPACECLQIGEFPADPSRHYPPQYYSFSGTGETGELPFWKRRVMAARARRLLEGKGILGWLVKNRIPAPDFIERWMAQAGIRQDSKILEAGCGQGHLLRQLATWGFTSLTGVDPFVALDLIYPDGVKVLRRKLADVGGEFDFVMMHHAFEHMDDPLMTLKEVHRLLLPGRMALIRIPLSSSKAWKKYGLNWVQLDAPRHYFLHSLKSMALLASESGFTTEKVVFDSTEFQFWGSEQYLRDIPLNSPQSLAVNPMSMTFSEAELRSFKSEAEALNATSSGDQACFFLRRV